jgi:hypothetical protein
MPPGRALKTALRALAIAAFSVVPLFVDAIKAADAGETLYNGIVLPREWPPHLSDFPTSAEKDPFTPPYLVSPPSVIPIDLGRQLFVDDFLIAETVLKRTFHLAKYHPANPVVKPDQPWEMKNPDHAAAMVFSDGVWYDPKDRVFKMWYLGGESAATGYATSTDGIRWNKPSLDVRPGPILCNPAARLQHGLLDLGEKDSSRRFKMFRDWRWKTSHRLEQLGHGHPFLTRRNPLGQPVPNPGGWWIGARCFGTRSQGLGLQHPACI